MSQFRQKDEPWLSEGETTPRIAGAMPGELSEDFPQQPGVANKPAARVVSYVGYKFFKADHILGEEATWKKAERIETEASHSELYKKSQKRANKVSAAQQYQMLPKILKAHVDQLIDEQRQRYPRGDWSCVYAKERLKASKTRNALREDYETVSMQVILMERPLQTRITHPRTPMGELVDLGPQFESGLNRSKRVDHEDIYSPYHWRYHLPGGTAVESEGGAPNRPAQPATADSHNPGNSENLNAMKEPRGLKRPWSHQEAIGNPKALTTFVGDIEPLSTHTGCPNKEFRGRLSPSLSHTHQDHCLTPAGLTSLEDMNDQTPYSLQEDNEVFSDMETEDFGHKSPCDTFETVQPRCAPSTKRTQLPALHDLSSGQRKRRSYVQSIQSMNEEELRARLVDCEAQIELWEKTFPCQKRMLQVPPHGNPEHSGS